MAEKSKKTGSITWAMISVLAVVLIICMAAYLYYFYFQKPGPAGIKSWMTPKENRQDSESAIQVEPSRQVDIKPDLRIIDVTVEIVDKEAAENSGEAGENNQDAAGANTPIKKNGEFFIGDTVKFKILIKNNGNQPARDIKIIDKPPGKLEYINIANGSDGLYDPFARKIVLDIPELAAGQTSNISFTGILSKDINDGEIIENEVSVLHLDSVISGKTTQLSVTGLPDYSETIVKVEDVNGSKLWTKDILHYTVVVKNSGKKTGKNIILHCPLPPKTGYLENSASGTGLKIIPETGLILFNIDKIEPGQQKEFSFKVFVAEYLTFSSDIESEFFINDGQKKIFLEKTKVTTEAIIFHTVVCMGDSQVVLTDYTTQLGLLLNSQYPHSVFNIIAAGAEGEMSNTAVQRFDKDVRIHNPDIVVIGYGCNDAGEPTGLYRYHMDILLSQAKSTGARVFVYGVGYIDLSVTKWLGKENYPTFNAILKNDLCPAYGATYVDIDSPMSKDYKSYIREDGMHWTEAGASLAAYEVFKSITAVLDSEGRIQAE